MKVNHTSGIQPTVAAEAGAPAGSRPPAAHGDPAPGGAGRPQVSARGRAAQAARRALGAQPEVRADLVQRLQHLIEMGAYQVDARAVARRLLDSGVLDA